MKSNVGLLDRIIRLALAAGAIWLFFTGERPTWEWAVLTVGVILGLTALVGVCPLYSILGMRTKKTG